MTSHKSWDLDLNIFSEDGSISQQEIDEFYEELIELVEDHGFSCGGGIKPSEESEK